jgi:hypothetical protein
MRFNFFFIKVITGIFNKRYFASLTCVFYLRHSSNWNPHRLHSEPFPPKENHNVGLLRFDDDHDHICYRFAQVQIFGGKSNVFKSLQCCPIPICKNSDPKYTTCKMFSLVILEPCCCLYEFIS